MVLYVVIQCSQSLPNQHPLEPYQPIHTNETKQNKTNQVHGLQGKNYRLVKDNLDRDIVPGESKWRVKGDRVTVQLKKARCQQGWLGVWGVGGGLPCVNADMDINIPTQTNTEHMTGEGRVRVRPLGGADGAARAAVGGQGGRGRRRWRERRGPDGRDHGLDEGK